MKIASSDRIFISGMTGSGKSHLAVHLILKNIDRWVFYDPKHNHKLDNCVIVHDVHSLAKSLEHPRLHYQPNDADEWQFNEMCRLVYGQGNRMLVIDEIQRHTTSYHIPKYLDYIVRMGRTRNVGLCTLTQRPNILNNNLISENEHFFLFRQQLDGDRQKLKGIIGDDAEQLNDLEKFNFMYYNFESGSILCKPIT